MRYKFDDTWPAILVVGAFVTGLVVGKLQYTINWQPGWDMVSGLGALAAAVSALLISGKESANRRRETDVKMVLTAARLYLPFAEASRRLGFIAEATRVNWPMSSCQEQYKLLLKELKGINLSISNDDLISLAPLANRAAHQLAGAIGSISVAIDLFESSEYLFVSWSRISQKQLVLSKIGFIATEAAQQLQKVATECQKVSIALTGPHH